MLYTSNNHGETKHVKTLINSIIQIQALISNSLEMCTCGDLYYFAESLSMDFNLPHIRLILFSS